MKDDEIDEEPFFLRTPVNVYEENKVDRHSKDEK